MIYKITWILCLIYVCHGYYMGTNNDLKFKDFIIAILKGLTKLQRVPSILFYLAADFSQRDMRITSLSRCYWNNSLQDCKLEHQKLGPPSRNLEYGYPSGSGLSVLLMFGSLTFHGPPPIKLEYKLYVYVCKGGKCHI